MADSEGGADPTLSDEGGGGGGQEGASFLPLQSGSSLSAPQAKNVASSGARGIIFHAPALSPCAARCAALISLCFCCCCLKMTLFAFFWSTEDMNLDSPDDAGAGEDAAGAEGEQAAADKVVLKREARGAAAATLQGGGDENQPSERETTPALISPPLLHRSRITRASRP